VKGDRRAAAGRLMPLVKRYPLYSKSDSALWMLGDIFEKSERKDLAGSYYAQIVKNYPLSTHDGDAKAKLKEFGMPVPQADPKAVQWMTAEQNTPRPKENLVHRGKEMLHSSPDVDTAARNGLPNMEPDSDEGGGDVLKGGNHSDLGGARTGAVVDVVKPGDPTPAGAPPDSTSTTQDSTSSSTSTEAAPAATGAGDPPPAAAAAVAAGTETTAGSAAGGTAAPAASGTAGTAAASGTPNQEGSASSDGAKEDNTQSASADNTQSNKDSKESSSKKKGLKKLLPW
jgi:hypothetical protein